MKTTSNKAGNSGMFLSPCCVKYYLGVLGQIRLICHFKFSINKRSDEITTELYLRLLVPTLPTHS